jgi:hypothetical protein
VYIYLLRHIMVVRSYWNFNKSCNDLSCFNKPAKYHSCVGAMARDDMCTYCTSSVFSNHHLTYWLGAGGEFVFFLNVFLPFILWYWFAEIFKFSCENVFIIQAKKAIDRVNDSMTPESIVSWSCTITYQILGWKKYKCY